MVDTDDVDLERLLDNERSSIFFFYLCEDNYISLYRSRFCEMKSFRMIIITAILYLLDRRSGLLWRLFILKKLRKKPSWVLTCSLSSIFFTKYAHVILWSEQKCVGTLLYFIALAISILTMLRFFCSFFFFQGICFSVVYSTCNVCAWRRLDVGRRWEEG